MSELSTETTHIEIAVDRTTILLAAIDAAGIPNDTALLDIREENGYLHVLCPADLRVLLDALEGAKAVLDGRLSNHHDACASWRRGFMCDCWRAELRAALGMGIEDL